MQDEGVNMSMIETSAALCASRTQHRENGHISRRHRKKGRSVLSQAVTSLVRPIRTVVPLVAGERVRSTNRVVAILALLGRALQVHRRNVLCDARSVELATTDRAFVPEAHLALLLRSTGEFAVPIANMTFDARSGDVVEHDAAAMPQARDASDGVLGKKGYGLEARGHMCEGLVGSYRLVVRGR